MSALADPSETDGGALHGTPSDDLSNIDPRKSRPWYIVTDPRGVDSLNLVRRIRKPCSRFSWNLSGLILLSRPSDVRFYADGLQAGELFIWEVRPLLLLGGVRHSRDGNREPRLRALGMRVRRQLPIGAEFGPHGAQVRALIAHLAERDVQQAVLDNNDVYREQHAAMEAAVARALAENSELSEYMAMAESVYRVLSGHRQRSSGSPRTLLDRMVLLREQRHNAAVLLRAEVASIPIPPAVSAAWELPCLDELMEAPAAETSRRWWWPRKAPVQDV